jgi:hypothetical protein
MIETEIRIRIKRPKAEVFAVLGDMEQNPSWQNGMRACVWKTDPPVRVGSIYDQKAEFMGKEIISTFEVTEYHPDYLIKATTLKSTFPITFTRWVTEIDETTTEVEAFIRGDSSGVFRVFERLYSPLVHRLIKKDYAKLKRLLEDR